MKKLLFVAAGFVFMSFSIWQPNFETAKKQAAKNHDLILLNFSGSDWCGPCMRMRREIFDDSVFTKMSDTALQMVNADFPRNKKHQLDKITQHQNELLADKYNPEGKFPFTLLLNADGKVLKTWDGMPDEDAATFAKEVQAICDATK